MANLARALRLPAAGAAPARRVLAAPSTPARVPSRVIVARPEVRMAATQPVEQDFDVILNNLAEKFEKTENKVAVVGYLSASVLAVVFAEWLIHLPGLDILLGWPVQFLGVLALPVLGVRYYLQKDNSLVEDLEGVVEAASKELPGLGK